MYKPYASASVIIEIPFHDIDMMRVVWHGHYAKYLEVARDALFDAIEYPVGDMYDSGYLWPIIELHIRYAQPLKYRQKVRVEASLVEIEHRLKVSYSLHDADTGQRITRAHTVQVALQIDSGEMLLASPAILTDRFSK